jgi:hypothetical protein
LPHPRGVTGSPLLERATTDSPKMHNRHATLLGCLLPAFLSLAACGAANDSSPADGAGGKSSHRGTGGSAADDTGSGAVAGSGAVDGSGGAGIDTGSVTPTVPGTEYVFQTGTFSVPPGAEVYKCQDFTNPFTKDIGIVEMTTELTPGSHHMFAFVMPNEQLGIFDNLADCPGGGIEFHDYLMTSGTPLATNTYPDGIGRVFTAGNGLRLNVHLINAGTDPREAFVKFHVVYNDPAGLEQKAASIFLNQVVLSVPPGTSTQSRTYNLTEEIWLRSAASHMHKRGVHFVATTDAGDQLYDGTDWQEPKVKMFDPALHLMPGTKITWACTYNNDTAQRLTFGESAANNEMCIFPGEFYNSTGTQISYQAIF